MPTPYWLEHPVAILLGVLAFHTVGLLHVIHALMHVRTSQGTIAWIVCLVSFPYVAIPFYWVFGRQRFQGFVKARREGSSDFACQMEDMYRAISEFEEMPSGPHSDFLESARRLADLPILGGNHTRLLVDGSKTFARMFETIDTARDYVLVLFFIFKDDRVGTEFKDLLIRKAREGVRVYFLYDSLGSHSLPRRFIREMREAGIEVEGFGRNHIWWSRFQINFRNHRKIVVVDGHTCYVGGLNVGDEYRDGHPTLGRWRDTHFRIHGPSVQAVQLVFLEDWHWATGRIPQLSWKCDPLEDGRRVLVLPTGPSDPFDSWQIAVIGAAATARKRLWIASPYFVPDEAVTAALQNAALRGVDVRVLLPKKPDHLLVYLSSFSYYPDVIPCGVSLHRYHKGFMHQKVVLIDTDIAIIGTANIDNRSFRLNFEISCLIDHPEDTAEVAAMLENDFRHSHRASEDDFQCRPFWFRLACRAARLLAPIQ